MLKSSHHHNMVDSGVTFVMQKSLLCNLQIPETLSQWSLYAAERPFNRASHVLCDAALSICLSLCCLYHVPGDIAVITVCYHTEVDKLN